MRPQDLFSNLFSEVGGKNTNFGAVAFAAGYRASGIMKGDTRPGPNSTPPIVKGCLVDSITRVHGRPPLCHSEATRRSISALLDWLKKIEHSVLSSAIAYGGTLESCPLLRPYRKFDMFGFYPGSEHQQDYLNFLAWLQAHLAPDFLKLYQV
jgi:hypothetical protein